MKQGIDSMEIAMYAASLADNFMAELYGQSGEGYIAALHTISAWAHEFYQRYYEKLKEWETFEESSDNIYQAICWDDFVIAWGGERLTAYLFNKQ